MLIEQLRLWLIVLLASSSIESLSFQRGWIKQLLPKLSSPFASYFPSSPKTNLTSLKATIFSCLEDKKVESVANYVNCHAFCLSCNQGFGRCVDSEGLSVCVCDCKYPVQHHKECSSVTKYCKHDFEFDFGRRRNSDRVLEQCKESCESLGFSDGALCGLDDDSLRVRPTCTCLCPQLTLD